PSPGAGWEVSTDSGSAVNSARSVVTALCSRPATTAGVRGSTDRRATRGSVVVEGAGALERAPPLLAGLRLLAFALDRWLLVVGPPFHLLEEAIFLHLFLELLQRGLDLVVEDLDPHSPTSKVRGGPIPAHRFRAVHDVHLDCPLHALRHRAGDRGKGVVRLLDDLTCVVDDAPAPVRIQGSRERHDLHAGLAPTTDSRRARRSCIPRRRSERRPSPRAWQAPPSASGRP